MTIDDTTALEILPDVACSRSGQHYLVAWENEYAGGDRGIWARLIWADMTMSAGVALVHPLGTSDRSNPAVAGGAPRYLVAWEQSRPDGSQPLVAHRVRRADVVELLEP